MKASSILAGMGVGLAVGTTAAVIGGSRMNGKAMRTAKKSAARLKKTMGGFAGDVAYLFK